MNEPIGQGCAAVSASYHQFLISDEEGGLGPELPPHHNGLVHAEDGEAYVQTGIHTGNVEVTVPLHRAEPAPDPGRWQEIVEIPAHSASGGLGVRRPGPLRRSLWVCWQPPQYGADQRAAVPDPDATVMGPTRKLSTNPVQRRLQAGESGIPRRLMP
ncbi:hypothetical protein [Wenjunlia tyrosinilytica]|uniref:Uncharacterized protein n=1 Tax=Wenjunlia tyrosinilytica TaxID=1544741 RepID=A0A918E0Z6_9ACTN|nr:hypothetical protein [Wenjunlia tyrosinilytica]GGO94712.1 hypothetical protein GCM10012280_50260 [Wenjunlia tyrosinilytica]